MSKYAGRSGDINELPQLELELGYGELTALFAEGKVPREEDYLKLLSYIHYLHVLLGVEGRDVPALGEGLNTSGGRLYVDLKPWVGNALKWVGGVVSAQGSNTIKVTKDSIDLVSATVSDHMIYSAYGATHKAVHENFIFLFSSRNGMLYARGFVKSGYSLNPNAGHAVWKYETNYPEQDSFYCDEMNVFAYYKNAELKVGAVVEVQASSADHTLWSAQLTVEVI